MEHYWTLRCTTLDGPFAVAGRGEGRRGGVDRTCGDVMGVGRGCAVKQRALCVPQPNGLLRMMLSACSRSSQQLLSMKSVARKQQRHDTHYNVLSTDPLPVHTSPPSPPSHGRNVLQDQFRPSPFQSSRTTLKGRSSKWLRLRPP